MVSLLGLDIDGMAIMDKAEDAALIVAAVNALPALLDVVRDAERLLRRIENTSFNYSEAELLARALAHLDATSPGAGREP